MNLSTKLDGYSQSVFTILAQKKAELRARGVPVIDLSIGTPDLPPSPHIMKALSDAACDPVNYRYAIHDRPQLLEAAARWYERRFHVSLDPKAHITSLLGSQDGLAHLALAVLDPGDAVLVPDPGYPIFHFGPYLAGARLIPMPQLRENGYAIDLDAIDPLDAKRARLMIVSYPNNPTCGVAPTGFYEKLVAFAKKYDIAVLHDNAYCELTFDGLRAGSFLQTPGAMDVGVEFNSLSKTYGMPGCRCGFALGNAELISKLRAIKGHIDYGMFLPAQLAAEAALNGPQDSVEEVRLAYERRRDVLVDGLNAEGWPIDKPRATMFVWARLPKGYHDSFDFAIQMMNETGVIAVPGVSFGERGEGHLRFGLVQSEDTLQKAVERIAASGIITRRFATR